MKHRSRLQACPPLIEVASDCQFRSGRAGPGTESALDAMFRRVNARATAQRLTMRNGREVTSSRSPQPAPTETRQAERGGPERTRCSPDGSPACLPEERQSTPSPSPRALVCQARSATRARTARVGLPSARRAHNRRRVPPRRTERVEGVGILETALLDLFSFGGRQLVEQVMDHQSFFRPFALHSGSFFSRGLSARFVVPWRGSPHPGIAPRTRAVSASP
jgi:hypothetical protein